MDLTEYKDFDNFFYYGQGDFETEQKSNVLSTVIQPNRSLFYDRFYDSVGIHQYENNPSSIVMQILIPFAIVSALSKMNMIVSNGENGLDRRVAVSQNLIQVELGNNGQIDISIQFISFININSIQNVSLPVGGF